MWQIACICITSFGDAESVPRPIYDVENDLKCVSSFNKLMSTCEGPVADLVRARGIDVLQINTECMDHEVIYEMIYTRPLVIHYRDTCLGKHSKRVKEMLTDIGYVITKGLHGTNTLACLKPATDAVKYWSCRDFHSVMSAFSSSNTFVQFGANDGVTNNPLRRYVAAGGFSGIMAEPVQATFRKLQSLYEGRPGTCLYNGALHGHERCVNGIVTK